MKTNFLKIGIILVIITFVIIGLKSIMYNNSYNPLNQPSIMAQSAFFCWG